MKFHNRAFPYPILDSTDETRDDYIDSNYTVSLSQEVNDSENLVSFKLEHMCSIGELDDLVEKGFGKYGVLVINGDTLFREIFLSDQKLQTFNLTLNDLYGKVEFIPQIIATKKVEAYTSKDLNQEYGEITFELNPGDVLAKAEASIRFFEFNKLSFETLISVRTSKDVHPNRYVISLENNFIFIDMGTTLRKLWDELRTESQNRPFLAMSIYKDCFFHALYDLSYKYDEVSDSKWAKSLSQKLKEMNIEIEEDQDINKLNEIAQQILESETIEKLKIKKD
jgi:hypothetical protein